MSDQDRELPPAPPPFNGGPPHNIEAEQAVLGALLYENDAWWAMSDWLGPEHFYDPLHARVYEAVCKKIEAGTLADAVTLRPDFEDDPGMLDIGGAVYLADLMREAPDSASAVEYAKLTFDLALRRELIKAGKALTSLARDSIDEMPASQVLQTHEGSIFSLASGYGSGSRRGHVRFETNIETALANADAAHSSGGVSGLSTGLISLDKKLGGLHRSDLIILAGRPSMGKTALATNIAYNLASRFDYERNEVGEEILISGGRVAFQSLEMAGDQIAARILADQTGISTYRQRAGKFRRDELEELHHAGQRIKEYPLWIDDTGGISITQLCARARRHKRMYGLDVLVVDYLQLVTAKGKDGRVQEVSEITRQLKALAKELNIPVIALSQLSRAVEQRDNKRPQLSDLRESGSIEQDADVVLFCYREAYYHERMEPKAGSPEHIAWEDELQTLKNQAEVIIGKQRHGPIGAVKLHFEPDTTRFTDLRPEEERP